MGQDKKINPGDFVNKMYWMIKNEIQSASGAVKIDWIEGGVFLSSIIKHETERDKEDRSKLLISTLVFITWNQNINPDLRVSYNSVQYTVDSISLLQKGVFAEYTCTYRSNQDDTNNDA